MAKKSTRENTIESPEKVLQDVENDLTQEGLIEQQEDEVSLDLRQRVQDTFDYYPSESSLWVTNDGTPFLEKHLFLAQQYAKSSQQKIYKIQR